MSTTPLTDAINALTTYANTVTGQNDPDLSTAVATLASGYGGGGGGVDINEIADGSYAGAITLTTTNIQAQRFKGMTGITSVTASNVTTLREQIFYTCTGLQSISFANATGVNSTQQFLGCTSLTSVDLPKLLVPGGNMFQGCTNLEVVDFPAITRMNVSRLFYGCTKLKTLVLRYTSVVSLNNDVFTNTPFGSGGSGGTVYIPKSLYDQLGTGTNDYTATANWSTLYTGGTVTFAKIEGSIYE